MAKGIYERKGLNGDVTYYISYQYDGTDIKERVGKKSGGVHAGDGEGCLEVSPWRRCAREFQRGFALELGTKPEHFFGEKGTRVRNR